MMLLLELLESVLTKTVKKGEVRKLADTLRKTSWKLSFSHGPFKPQPPVWKNNLTLLRIISQNKSKSRFALAPIYLQQIFEFHNVK